MASTTPKPLLPTLFDLPNEIIVLIASYLDYHSLLPFRRACHAIAALISLDELKARRHSLKTALLAEEQAEYADRQSKFATFSRWARAFPHEYRTWGSSDTLSNIHANFITKATSLNCYACLRKLPRECFTDGQAMGSRSLGHREANRRFCKLCGVNKGIWLLGMTMRESKQTWIFCKACRSITKADWRFKQDGVCSSECLGFLIDRIETDCVRKFESMSLERRKAPIKGLTSGTQVFEPGRRSTRASRCLRCWATDHTEKPADGQFGLNICKTCEGFVSRPGREMVDDGLALDDWQLLGT